MSYSVWIMVENDDDTSEPRIYWSVDHHDTKNEAIEHAEEVADDIYEQVGVRPERLED